MHIFFQPNLTQDLIALDEDESKHCVRVLRMEKGETVKLVNGAGTIALATLIDHHPKKCVLRIDSRQSIPKTRDGLHICIAPTKNAERIEWFLEKAVEMGVSSVSFMETARSEKGRVNHTRLLKIAVSAIKQSGQAWLPELKPVVSFGEIINSSDAGFHKLIAWCEATGGKNMMQVLEEKPGGNVQILIGPEGDFTAAEVQQAQLMGYIPVSLGKAILRTETAALFAVAAYHLQQMK